MKRSETLASLSRDHHRGLVVAQRLKRAGDDASAATARENFLSFWRTEGERHFEIEESVLLPRCQPHLSPSNEAVARVLADHAELRRRAEEVAGQAEAPVRELNELGELLEGHIRHEERVLFPLIEQVMSAPELSDLTWALAAAEEAKPS